MLFNKAAMLSLIGVAFTGVLTTADTIQVNFYSDSNCTDYITYSNPGSCDSLPSGANSMLIADCSADANCDSVALYTQNNGGCADQYQIGALQCPCPGENSNPSPPCLDLSSNLGIAIYVGIASDDAGAYLFQTSLQ